VSSRFAIVTDSAADMGALAQTNGVEVVPITIRFGNQEFRDGIDLSSAEFYARLETSAQPPITAQPAPAAFVDTYRRLLAEGAERILSLHISAALSGTFNAASIGAAMVDARRIAVVDTRSVSAGIAMLAIDARRRFEAGDAFEDVEGAIRADVPCVEFFATVPNLTYLARGGRIGGVRGLMGNVLKIVPILTLKNGEVSEHAKVRTFARAVDQLVQTAIERMPVKGRARIAVLHSVAPELAASIRERLRIAAEPVSEITCDIGPTVGTHAGPGAVGVCFIP
jgi:DegV family protein with EDD domain